MRHVLIVQVQMALPYLMMGMVTALCVTITLQMR